MAVNGGSGSGGERVRCEGGGGGEGKLERDGNSQSELLKTSTRELIRVAGYFLLAALKR